MAKLTLNVDEEVIERAKRFAEQRGTSVSAIVEQLLEHVTRPPEDVKLSPIVESLRGVAKGADVDDYYRYLERKYL